MWSHTGVKEMVLSMAEASLALCCKMLDMSLSLDPLLNTVSQLFTSHKVSYSHLNDMWQCIRKFYFKMTNVYTIMGTVLNYSRFY